MKKIFMLTMIVVIFFMSPAKAADWVWIYSDDCFSIWVDNNSITHGSYQSNYSFKAFIKWTYSEAGKRKKI